MLAAFVHPGDYIPLSERLLPRGRWARLAAVGLFAALPFVQLVAYALLSGAAGLERDPQAAIERGLVNRFLNAYLIVLTLWGASWAAAQLRLVAKLDPSGAWPIARWPAWLAAPIVLDLVAGTITELGHIAPYGLDAALATPAPFLASFAISFLVRLPQLVAFWTAVVALLATAGLGRPPLPAAFPEDPALGFRPAGELVFRIFVTYAAAFLPGFAFGTMSVPDLFITFGLFGAGVAAMVLATWRIHLAMAAERKRLVRIARARYAETYRAAEAAVATSSAKVAERMSLAEGLLRGVETIQEWPFDERTQRIAAIVLTGAVTSIIVRMILLAFGI